MPLGLRRGIDSGWTACSLASPKSPRRPHPPDLPRAVDSQFDFQGWNEIEDDPEPFLALRLCSQHWLEAALPILRYATEIDPSTAKRSCTSTCGATTSVSATAARS